MEVTAEERTQRFTAELKAVENMNPDELGAELEKLTTRKDTLGIIAQTVNAKLRRSRRSSSAQDRDTPVSL